MSKYAPVANLAMYDRLLELGLLGNYHLLIATEVVKDLEGWANFWQMRMLEAETAYTPKPFVIMDNGLIEAGAATDSLTIKEASYAVGASCIVLPDVLGDYQKTVKAVKASFIEMEQLGWPLMGVIQGRTFDEVMQLAEFYVHLGVRYLSIPRIMVKLFGSRTELVRRVSELRRPIHLLGFSDNLYDDMKSARMPGVMGIDSATPLWYQGIFPPTPPTQMSGKRPENFWSMSADEANYQNVARVKEWLRDARDVRMQEEQQGLEDLLMHQSASSEKLLEQTSSEREFRS